MPAGGSGVHTASAEPLRFARAVGHQNMQQLIQLRWIAVIGQIVTIAVVTLGYRVQLPLPKMVEVLACLGAFNIASQLRWHERTEVADAELFVALLVDVAALTLQLYLSGGTTNPFVFLYLLQVILGAVLLKARWTWVLVAITATCFAGLALLAEPLRLPLDHDRGLTSLYVQGMLICFVLVATLLVISIKRISRNLRERDARLADLRQRAAEDEHIVRMGLLASGAAHELGTPLATLYVILGDWRRMPELRANAELRQEIEEMQAQVERCKSIVSGILLSAGEARGESSVKTSLRAFLDELAEEWRSTRAPLSFVYENQLEPDQVIVCDSTLKQMICNVLDNALEASPRRVGLRASYAGENLVLTITDQGPGFPPAMLAQLGKPYQSSKGRPGSGLGLFLAVNVARTLGGTLTASNRPDGGAAVRLTLPLATLTISPHGNADR